MKSTRILDMEFQIGDPCTACSVFSVAILDFERFLVWLQSVDHLAPEPYRFGALISDEDSDNLSKNFKTGIKEVGRLRIGKILRKNRWMSDEEKMIYLQFYNEIEFWSFNTVSNEIKWNYIIIDILEALSFAENVKRQNMEYR